MTIGLWFPEKGELVGYRVASDNEENQHLGVVTGYELWPLKSNPDFGTRVFIHFIDVNSGCKNARILRDIEKPVED